MRQPSPVPLIAALLGLALLRPPLLVEAEPPARPVRAAPLRWVAAGGGPTPELNQVSIEADLALAREVLGAGSGLLLFAGGPETRAVQVRAPVREGLMQRLGAIFSPRGGRDATYRTTTARPDGAATADGILDAVESLVTGEPLLLLMGHGERGNGPRDAALLTWGDEVIGPADLAQVLDAAPPSRRIRVIVTSCYSGGFAELVFKGADPGAGPAEGDRCGLFASTWDAEASGCDPDPDRRNHDGYALHLLNALRGRDRAGELPDTTLDLDGDGRISLLEAHTRARVAMRSLGVPTTTSERWLRAEAPESGPQAEVALPEEDAVVRALAERLDLTGREGEARRRHRDLRAGIEAARRAVDEAEREEQAAFRRAAGRLLSRWPVLDDPWHPEFPATLTKDGAAIAEALDSWPELLALREAATALDRAGAAMDTLELRASPYERLARAAENRAMARRLAAKGGPGWERYQRLLACERSAP